MTSSLTVRRYRPADNEQIRQLHETAMRDAGAFDEGRADSDLDSIQETYLEAGGEFLVGTLNNQVIAMGAFRPATGYMRDFLDGVGAATATIKRMRVDPGHQRRGYGKQILDELERRAAERGFDNLVLDTTATQHAAQQFYETHGFGEVHREPVQLSGKSFELVLYRKSIEEA